MAERRCRIERFDPTQCYGLLSGVPDNITYDPALNRARGADFVMIRGQSHDGTLYFFHDMIAKMLLPLANRETWAKKRPPTGPVSDIRYTVGKLRVGTVFGRVDIPAGNFPGQRERYRMPVRVEYVYARAPDSVGAT